jgi:hypothetical protein
MELCTDLAKGRIRAPLAIFWNHRLYSYWNHLTEGLRTGLPQNANRNRGVPLCEDVPGSNDRPQPRREHGYCLQIGVDRLQDSCPNPPPVRNRL